MARRATPIAGSFTSVRRVGPTQQVREQLVAAIQSGEYLPGSALPSERVLCETFGVSRVSVREAIAGLESTGLVRVEHGRGAFVRDSANNAYIGPFIKYLEMHRDELIELLKVRGALDELAAVEATQHLTAATKKELQAAADVFKDAVEAEGHDFKALAELDIAFHLQIASSSSGDLLHQLLAELNDIFRESRLITLSRPGQLEQSVEEHQAIVDAILNGDPDAARRAVATHLAGVREWLDGLPVDADAQTTSD
jgi:GntR family transcriptional repressor for pyruvate dehydrogenase complex